jgi:hypothetical protein
MDMRRDAGEDRPEDPDRVETSLSSTNANCVEVAILADGQISVRNGRDLNGAVLLFASDEWRAFIAEVRDGEFDGLGMAMPSNTLRHYNRYSFLQWVLADPWRTLRFALLVAVVTTAAVLAPHLVKLLW